MVGLDMKKKFFSWHLILTNPMNIFLCYLNISYVIFMILDDVMILFHFSSRKLKELQNDNDEKCQNIIKTTSENCQINLVEVDKVICLLYIVCELSTNSARINVINTCSCSLGNKQYHFNIIVDYISIPNSFRFP